MKFPLPGPLGEAYCAFPSPLAMSKPMLYQAEDVQHVTAPAFFPGIRQAVGGQFISEGVAR
jgi:hypothetical protein